MRLFEEYDNSPDIVSNPVLVPSGPPVHALAAQICFCGINIHLKKTELVSISGLISE